MESQTEIIIYFIKLIFMNCYAFYAFDKILNIKNKNVKEITIILVFNIVITILGTYIEFYINSFLSMIIVWLLYGSILGIVRKNKIGFSLIISIIAYAISMIALVVSVIIMFFIYRLINIDNKCLNLRSY